MCFTFTRNSWWKKLSLVGDNLIQQIQDERKNEFEKASMGSPILRFLEWAFFHLQFASAAGVFDIPPPHVQEARKARATAGKTAAEKKRIKIAFDGERAKTVDYYLIYWWIVEVVLFLALFFFLGKFSLLPAIIITALCGWRLLDLMVTTVNQNILNYFRYEKARNSSRLRNLVIVIVNFFEVALLFSIMSAAPWLEWCSMGRSRLYQSLTTQFTIGGLQPNNFLAKLMLIIQMSMAFLLTAIFIAKLAGSLPLSKDSSTIEDSE